MKKKTNELDLELLKTLNEHPYLKDRIERILRVGQYEGSGCTTAAEAEMVLMEEIRGLGREALKQWAINGEIKAVEEARKNEETGNFEFRKKKA
jgi:hypothetical protein